MSEVVPQNPQPETILSTEAYKRLNEVAQAAGEYILSRPGVIDLTADQKPEGVHDLSEYGEPSRFDVEAAGLVAAAHEDERRKQKVAA